MSAVYFKFDVGGTTHRVSRSLLDRHQGTLLAKSAYSSWWKGPEHVIFIERDGELFRYVLNYLRDGQVTLPLTVSREAFIRELNYYGVRVLGDHSISVTNCIQPMQAVNVIFSGMKRANTELQKTAKQLERKRKRVALEEMQATLASKCIEACMFKMVDRNVLRITVDKVDGSVPVLHNNYFGFIIGCNTHLNKVGLEIAALDEGKSQYTVIAKTMRKTRKVFVSGAGSEAVNGVYTACGDRNGVGMFTKIGVWEGEERVFGLACLNVKSGDLKWHISILDRVGKEIKLVAFYRNVRYGREGPFDLCWETYCKGVNPPPTVSLGEIVKPKPADRKVAYPPPTVSSCANPDTVKS